MIKTRAFGKTDLKVSEIGFGCWAVGGHGYGATNDDESLEALETAFSKGVNFYDTADTYGFGHSEELVAKFLEGKPRDEIILATKVGWDFYREGGSKKNFDPAYIKEACEKSLKRLGVEAIDLYQLHNPTAAQIEEGSCVEALADLKKQGKIRFAGISVHTEADARAAMSDSRIDSLQLVLNIFEQKMSEAILPEACKKGVALVIREPLACGLLTGKYDSTHEFEKDDHRRRWVREKREADAKKLEDVKRVLATERFTLARAALEFVLDFSEVATVIPGAKTKTQVLENLKASRDPMLRSQDSFQLRRLYEQWCLSQSSS